MDARRTYFESQLNNLAKCTTWDDLQAVCTEIDTKSHQLGGLYPDNLQSKPVHDLSDNLLKQIPDIQPGLKPICAYGDGNCLYRSVSLVFNGNEDNHVEFRVRTIVEMVLHENYYTSGDCVNQLEIKDENTFNYLINVSLPPGMTLNDRYRMEIMNNRKLGTFSSMFHMIALETLRLTQY